MIYKLSSNAQIFLMSIPETGLGYQVISAVAQYSWLEERFVVYNTELAIEEDSDFSKNKEYLLKYGFNDTLIEANILDLKIESIILFKHIQDKELVPFMTKDKDRKKGGKGAKESPYIKATGEDYFVRLSAYENDRRIDRSGKRLRKGSFTTDIEDYVRCLNSEDDPVDRYALPNDEEIKWAYFIRPYEDELYQKGIVQPAFGHLGGGVEEFFEFGTKANTYLGKTKYGENPEV